MKSFPIQPRRRARQEAAAAAVCPLVWSYNEVVQYCLPVSPPVLYVGMCQIYLI